MIAPTTDLVNQVKVAKANYSQTTTTSNIPSIITAGAGTDNIKAQGDTVDRLGYMSGVLAVEWAAVLANTKTISMAVEYVESDDGSTWGSATVLQAATVLATGDGVTTEYSGVVELGLKLKPRKRYLRFDITVDLSNTGTDTALFGAAFVMAGADVVPAA